MSPYTPSLVLLDEFVKTHLTREGGKRSFSVIPTFWAIARQLSPPDGVEPLNEHSMDQFSVNPPSPVMYDLISKSALDVELAASVC